MYDSEQSFNLGQLPQLFETAWVSPSNIALVKYWGKFANQIPANPSLSFTLSSSVTKTRVVFSNRGQKKYESVGFTFYLDGVLKEEFNPKISNYLERIVQHLPFLKYFHLDIFSENNFPHSSGIASSASAFSALSLCMVDLETQIFDKLNEEKFKEKASFLARLGSGSACRSVDGPLVLWGETPYYKRSSNLYGIKIGEEVDDIFKNYQDTILIVEKGKKGVSSSKGHSLMESHYFSKNRFQQAKDRIEALKNILEQKDIEGFISLVESEALTLHAMMMTSHPYYILMKPNTLSIIHRVWEYRQNTDIPICFTLDAGANVHLLYPKLYKKQCMEFIRGELLKYCENNFYICDCVGEGSKRVKSLKNNE